MICIIFPHLKFLLKFVTANVAPPTPRWTLLVNRVIEICVGIRVVEHVVALQQFLQLVVIVILERYRHFPITREVDYFVQKGSILNQYLLLQSDQIIPLLQAHLKNVLLIETIILETLLITNEIPHIVLLAHKSQRITDLLLHGILPLEHLRPLLFLLLLRRLLILH